MSNNFQHIPINVSPGTTVNAYIRRGAVVFAMPTLFYSWVGSDLCDERVIAEFNKSKEFDILCGRRISELAKGEHPIRLLRNQLLTPSDTPDDIIPMKRRRFSAVFEGKHCIKFGDCETLYHIHNWINHYTW